MQKITPFLWLNHQAEQAAKFYASIYKNSKITNVARYPNGSPRPTGSVMTVAFQLNGQEHIQLEYRDVCTSSGSFSLNETMRGYVQTGTGQPWDKAE
jgi:predicted 3-demethylubiquinone-9 3-methyltransferase (glyoxalase superfamily)